VSGRHLKAGGLSPLSFAYFSLRRQRKVGAAPHRGNTNKPIRKQGKANTIGKQKRCNANKPKRKQGKANTQIKQKKHNAYEPTIKKYQQKQNKKNQKKSKKPPLPQKPETPAQPRPHQHGAPRTSPPDRAHPL
jgi:hypothetical protein